MTLCLLCNQQDGIIDQRKEKWGTDKETFNLDIVELKEFRLADDYLSNGFQDSFKYPLRCIVFVPRDKVSHD